MQNDKYSQSIDQYKIKKILGSGYSAEVKLGLSPKNEYVAIKQYKKQTSTLQTLKGELNIMKQLNHQNIVKLIDVREHAVNRKFNGPGVPCFAIVLQYVSGGELFNFIAQTGRFSEKVARTYFLQMLHGLEHIHNKGFAHRDIKCQNLLLNSDYVLKIADFGFSCMLKGRQGNWKLHTELGTQGYMAPQIPLQNYDGRRTDIFAAGVLLFIMYVGCSPFEKASINDPWYRLLKEKKYDMYWKPRAQKKPAGFFSQSFKDLIQKMLAYDPNQRPTILELLNHPWIKGSTSPQMEIIMQFQQRRHKLEIDSMKKRAERQQNIQKRKEYNNLKGFDHNEHKRQQICRKKKKQPVLLQKLQQYSLDDLIVDLNYPYVKDKLKEFLINYKFIINDQQNSLIGQIEKYYCDFAKEQQNYIHLRYVYKYVLNNEPIQSKVQLRILFGLTDNKETQIHFEFIDGNFFYYKMIINQIKMSWFP